VQALEYDFAICCQVWPADRCHGTSEEARAPLFVRSLALRSLLALLLFNLRLECCRERVLPADDGVRYAVPELERFVGQLFLHGRDGLGEREERVDIDDEMFLLCGCEDSVQTKNDGETHRNLVEGLVAERVVDLVLP
jgi:hypothetical protein